MWLLLWYLFILVLLLTGVAVAVGDLSDKLDRATTDEPRLVASDVEGDGVSELEIAQGRDGHFVLEAKVNGEPIEFLVDTGASLVVLGPETAERLGFDLDSLEFNSLARTANGSAPIARVLLDEIVIGDLTVGSVEAAIIEKPMTMSLLGMSFLARLGGYEVRDGRLVLRWYPAERPPSRHISALSTNAEPRRIP